LKGKIKKYLRFFSKNLKKTLIILGAVFTLMAFSGRILAQIQNLYNPSSDQIAGITPLMSAVADGDIDGVKFFSKAGSIVVNQRNYGGASALHLACRDGNFEIAKVLIENGANVNLADNEGWTPLMRASLAGNSRIVEHLIANGADSSAINSQKESAIIHASSSQCLECLNFIIDKADIAKKMDTIILKSQIADAFIIARNQENSKVQNLLESFLDYVSKIAPLVINSTTPSQENLPTISINRTPNLSSSNPNKPNKKNFVLRSGDLDSDNSNDTAKYGFIENPNYQKNRNLLPIYNLNQQPNPTEKNLTLIPSKKIYKFIKTPDNSSNPANLQKNSPKIMKIMPLENISTPNKNIQNPPKDPTILNDTTNTSPSNSSPKNISTKPQNFKFKVGKAPEIIEKSSSVPSKNLENKKSGDQPVKTLEESSSPKINEPQTKLLDDQIPNSAKTKTQPKIIYKKNIKSKELNKTQENPKTNSPDSITENPSKKLILKSSPEENKKFKLINQENSKIEEPTDYQIENESKSSNQPKYKIKSIDEAPNKNDIKNNSKTLQNNTSFKPNLDNKTNQESQLKENLNNNQPSNLKATEI